MRKTHVAAQARHYGIRSVPSIVVDGHLLSLLCWWWSRRGTLGISLRRSFKLQADQQLLTLSLTKPAPPSVFTFSAAMTRT
jgi:hypothetical protein